MALPAAGGLSMAHAKEHYKNIFLKPFACAA